jgi:hypothetical protein
MLREAAGRGLLVAQHQQLGVFLVSLAVLRMFGCPIRPCPQ